MSGYGNQMNGRATERDPAGVTEAGSGDLLYLAPTVVFWAAELSALLLLLQSEQPQAGLGLLLPSLLAAYWWRKPGALWSWILNCALFGACVYSSGIHTGSATLPTFLAAGFTSYCVAAVCNQQDKAVSLAESARERARVMQALHEVSLSLNRSLDVKCTLLEVHRAVTETLGFDRCGIYVVEPEMGTLHGVWGTDRQGNREDLGDAVLVLAAEGAMRRVISGELPFHYTEDYAHTIPNVIPLMEGVKHHAILPIRADGKTAGVLCVDNLITGRPISLEDAEAIVPFCQHAAIALHRAQLFESLSTTRDRLVKAERLRQLGQAAGGVAHDLNNVLSAILWSAQAARRRI
ncbi:MAG TPA: GAF domain-containing protein, partial [Armatimonadota bacterium]